MRHSTRMISAVICLSGLTGCTSIMNSDYATSRTTTFQGTQIYPETYEGNQAYSTEPTEKKPLSVPETYHVGAYHSPAPAADRDREWVNNQNPQAYTIELADDEKPAAVANTLLNAPKSERTAEVKYEKEGKAHYKGVYGSYPSSEAAQQALSNLPDDLKQRATVKSWSNVQDSTKQ